MFTGIVQTTGKINEIEKKGKGIYFTIYATPKFLKGVKIGDSISCDGVCLTVIKRTKNSFTTELMPETLRLTKFIDSRAGDLINLEPSLRMRGKIDGHFVAGHVDGVGVIQKIVKEGDYINLVVKVPAKIIKYLAYKGSVSVNGVSLTISGSGANWFKISLITHTLNITNLSSLKVGSKVNIEIDLIARYLEKLLKK